MRRKKVEMLLMGLVLSLIFCTAVWADGGMAPPPPGTPMPGPIILGTFTATYGDFKDNKATRFKIHAMLENRQIIGGKPVTLRRQFFFEVEKTPDSLPLCDYTDRELLAKYLYMPRKLKVAKKFGLSGTPLLLDVKVAEKGNCDNEMGAFIKGKLIIKVQKPNP